jgi:hypothetical protein
MRTGTRQRRHAAPHEVEQQHEPDRALTLPESQQPVLIRDSRVIMMELVDVGTTLLPPEYATSGYADYRPPMIDRSRGIAFRLPRLPRARRACGGGRPGGRRVAGRSSGGGSSGDPDLSDEPPGERAGLLEQDARHRRERDTLVVASCRPDCEIHAEVLS